MAAEEELELLKANIKCLKVAALWPDQNSGRLKIFLKNTSIALIMIIFTLSVGYEVLREMSGMRDDVNSLLEGLSSFGLALTTGSIIICFKINTKKIRNLVVELKELETFFVALDIMKMERRIRFLTKSAIFFTYCTNILYVFLPFVRYDKCQMEKKSAVHLKHVPCGVFTPMWLPFRYDDSPLFQTVVLLTLGFTFVFSYVGIGSTSFSASINMHIVGHIKTLKKQIRVAIEEKSREKFIKCVQYHIEIIQ